MYINIIHHKKFHPRNPITTLVLKYMCNFFKLYDNYYFVTNILHTFKFFIFVEFLKIIIRSSLKLIKYIYKKKKIQNVMSIHYQKIIAKYLYLWLQFLGGLMHFHPPHGKHGGQVWTRKGAWTWSEESTKEKKNTHEKTKVLMKASTPFRMGESANK